MLTQGAIAIECPEHIGLLQRESQVSARIRQRIICEYDRRPATTDIVLRVILPFKNSKLPCRLDSDNLVTSALSAATLFRASRAAKEIQANLNLADIPHVRRA